MIVCHAHRFIFIKTHKTAGTSIEIALSSLCGPGDIITTISPEDEATRQALGFRGPQHQIVPLSAYAGADWVRLLRRGQRARFRNHATAAEIIDHLPTDVWRGYFKFCFERNPWDKVVSGYFWDRKFGSRTSLQDYVLSGRANKWSNFDHYSVRGEIVVDAVLRYENLDKEVDALFKRFGGESAPRLPLAKHSTRLDRRHYSLLMGHEEREKVARVYAREIAHFGYRFDTDQT